MTSFTRHSLCRDYWQRCPMCGAARKRQNTTHARRLLVLAIAFALVGAACVVVLLAT